MGTTINTIIRRKGLFFRKFIIVSVILFMPSASAFAHGPNPFGHKPVEAVVVEKSGNDLVVQTKKGKYLIRRAHAARIFKGKVSATFQDISKDDAIAVVVARSEPGRIILARAIVISPEKEKK